MWEVSEQERFVLYVSAFIFLLPAFPPFPKQSYTHIYNFPSPRGYSLLFFLQQYLTITNNQIRLKMAGTTKSAPSVPKLWLYALSMSKFFSHHLFIPPSAPKLGAFFYILLSSMIGVSETNRALLYIHYSDDHCKDPILKDIQYPGIPDLGIPLPPNGVRYINNSIGSYSCV